MEFLLNVLGKTEIHLSLSPHMFSLTADTIFHYSEAATRRALWKKVFLEISQISLATWFNSTKVCNFIKKEALTQVFSCEFCEIFKSTYFEEHLQTAASDYLEISQ